MNTKKRRKDHVFTVTLTLPKPQSTERVERLSSTNNYDSNENSNNSNGNGNGSICRSTSKNNCTRTNGINDVVGDAINTTMRKEQNHHQRQKRSKRELMKQKWDEICQKWGITIVREMVFLQNSVFLEDDDSDEENGDGDYGMGNEEGKENRDGSRIDMSNNCGNENTAARIGRNPTRKKLSSPSPSIIIDGCEATKVKDQLVVSDIIQAQSKNFDIRPGDIIHAIYGMTNPKLGLLFGIMRDSSTFQYVCNIYIYFGDMNL